MKSLNESGAPLLLTRHESSSSSADEEKDRGQSLLDRLAAAFVAARPKQPGANYHRNMSAVLELPTSKACVNMSNGKRELEKEKSLTDSSTSSSAGSAGMGGGEGSRASAAAPASNGGGSKLSKIGRRLRDSCRNLRGKSSQSARHNPEDYTSVQAPNDSTRSKHYVAMDFTGKVGRIVDHKDVRGYTTKEGYSYFRRKVSPKEVEPLMTETQASVHLTMPWFHKGIGRDLAQRILATHNVDGAFLVRESSVSGGFVISYSFHGRSFHAQALPDKADSADDSGQDGQVYYSLDEGRTRFFDLLQMVEFYQMNRGSLNSRLTHYIVKGEAPASKGAEIGAGQRAESPVSRSDSSSCQASEASMESQSSHTLAASSSAAEAEPADTTRPTTKEGAAKMDTNHNNESAASANPGQAGAAASAEDATMASEGDSDSLREFCQG